MDDDDIPLNLHDIGDDVEFIKDEYVLSDMHLASAINLDQQLEMLCPGTIKYRLDIPHFVQKEYDNLVRIMQVPLGQGFKMKIGLRDPTVLMQYPGGDLASLPLRSYKPIANLVSRALRARDIQIPITQNRITEMLPDIQVYYTWGTLFNLLVQMICARNGVINGERSPYGAIEARERAVICNYVVGDEHFRISAHRYHSTITDLKRKIFYIGNVHQLLLTMDVIGQRLCLMISNQISELYQTPGHTPAKIIDDILTIGDTLLYRLGNRGYDVIAMFEALVVGKILKKSPDGITDESEFLLNCMMELEGMFESPAIKDIVMTAAKQWLVELEWLTIEQLSNVFCLYRCWGHPVVDIYAGMEKVHKLGTAKKFVGPFVPNSALCQFRKTFLINYYKEKHYYPPILFQDEIIGSYIHKCITENMEIDDRYPTYSTRDFMGLEIQKIWDVPITQDLCHILNDKAVSPNRDELVACIQSRGNTSAGIQRRGLVRWLQGESINCREFLSKIDKEGLPDNECIIGMYEKEREIKIVARMFSLMSENMKYYFVLTEDLMAKHVLPYFPEITMRDPLNVLQKKFWTIGGMGKEKSYDVNVNIDFSKWNLNMRDEFTNPIFKQIDKLFGFDNLISRTHEIFRRSYVYSSSGKYVPPISNGKLGIDIPMAYEGHLGGFEGLRQKGWTIATTTALLGVAEEQNVRVRIMGQGDNQIVRILMPTAKWRNYEYSEERMTASAQETSKQFIQKMDQTFHMARLPIKVRETWSSTRLFMYGKMILHDGKAMPQWFKKILRSYAMTNEGQVTMAGVVGTVATNMASAAGLSEMPDVMYIMFLIFAEWSIDYIIEYHPFTRKSILYSHETPVRLPGKKISGENLILHSVNRDRLVASLILIPTAAGGSVTIPLTGFIMRGFPDHASEAYAWIKMLQEVDSEYRTLLYNWYSFLPNTTIEADMLLQSPMALNHRKPPTPGLQSREIVRDWLLSGGFSKNKFMRGAKIILNSFDRKSVATSLLTDPMNPLVSSEIYNTHAHVYIDGILRRVENTSTVKKIAMQNQTTTTIVKRMMENEHGHIIYIAWRGDVRGEIYSGCATEHTRIARNVGWGRSIIGVTTPHPLELCMGTKCSGVSRNCPPTDYIYTRVDEKGQYVPYLGSRIRCKVVSDQDLDARKEPLIALGARVCRFATWLGVGPNLMEVVKRSIECVCDISIYDHFIDNDPKGQLSSGSIDHRFNPAGASEGVFINYAPQVGTTVYMSSDCMPKYGRGQTNYTLHFQALYCWIQYIASRTPYKIFHHWHIECDTCVVPTQDNVPDLPERFPHFDRLYSDTVVQHITDALGFIDKRGQLDITSDKRILQHTIAVDKVGVAQMRRGAVWCMAIKIAFSLAHTGTSTVDDIRVEDLQEFPRIYAYKVYRDVILSYVAHALVMLCSVEMGLSPTSIELTKIRRRATDKLIRMPLGCFKGLACLTLGRVDQSEANAHMFVTGNFPETVISVLGTAKAALIEVIGSVGKIGIGKLGILPIPKGALTKRQFRFLIMLRTYVEEQCTYYHMMFKEWPEEDDSHPLCSHDCVINMIVRTPVITMSLDKVMKHLETVKVKKETPTIEWNGFETLNCQIVCRDGAPSTVNIGDRLLIPQDPFRYSSHITLPTSSVYKWAPMLHKRPLRPHVVVLGDGTGGTSLLVKTLNKDSVVYPCSFLETHKIIPQDLDCLMPQLSRGYKGIEHTFMLNVPDDIFDGRWIKRMGDEILLIGVDNVTMLCDIEGQNSIDVIKVLRQLPPGLQVIIKLYGRDIYQSVRDLSGFDDVTLHHNPHLNIKNNEIIMEGYVTPGKSPDAEGVISTIFGIYGKEYEIPAMTVIEDEYVEAAFPFLVKSSISLALAHINKLGVTMTHEILQMEGLDIWAYSIQFVNRHYRPKGQSIMVKDGRVLTKALRRSIGRALLIILGFLTVPHYIEENMAWGLKTIGRPGDLGIRVALLPNCMNGWVTPTRKDLQAANCLYAYWTTTLMRQVLPFPNLQTGGWLLSAVKRRSFASTMSMHSSHDFIDVYETED